MAGQTIAQIRRLMSNDETIGMGFNSDSGLALGLPFKLEEMIVEADPHAPGQNVFSTITLVNSHEELMDSLGLSVAAQGRYGFFSADLKAEYAESSSYNSTSTFLIAKVVVENPFKRGRGFKLTEDATALVAPGQEAVFKGAFGDSFVRGLQTGGEFYSVIRITSVSQTTQTELAVSLQAEYQGLVAGGSFQGKFNQANSSATTRSEFNAMMFQRAGTGDSISPTTDIAEVLARVKAFPAIVQAAPVAYEIEVATYDTIPVPIPTPFEEEAFAEALQDASSRRLRYIQTRNDLEFARQHPVFFTDLPDDSVLADAITTYTQLLTAVNRHGIKLSTGRLNPPDMFDPSALNPPLQEPAPIQLKRAPSVPVGTVKLPNLIGVDTFQLSELVSCMAHGGDFAGCMAGTVFTGEDGIARPVVLEEDVANFVNMYFTKDLKVTWLPAPPDDVTGSLPGPSKVDVTAQTPPGGTEVPLGTEVFVQITVTPLPPD